MTKVVSKQNLIDKKNYPEKGGVKFDNQMALLNK